MYGDISTIEHTKVSTINSLLLEIVIKIVSAPVVEAFTSDALASVEILKSTRDVKWVVRC